MYPQPGTMGTSLPYLPFNYTEYTITQVGASACVCACACVFMCVCLHVCTQTQKQHSSAHAPTPAPGNKTTHTHTHTLHTDQTVTMICVVEFLTLFQQQTEKFSAGEGLFGCIMVSCSLLFVCCLLLFVVVVCCCL